MSNPACNNRKINSDQNIYTYMAHMSDIENFPSGSIGDNYQFINLVLDSGAKCHITPVVSDFIPDSLEVTYKHIEVAEGHPMKEETKRTITNKNMQQ